MKNVIVHAGRVFLAFKRVSYGKKDMPKEKREYRLEGISMSPVGTRKEIKAFMRRIALSNRFDGVVLTDSKSGDPAKDFREFILTDDL